MKRFLENFGYKLRQWMQGRYGTDELSRFLLILACVLVLLSRLPHLRLLYTLALLLLIYSCFRCYSRNISGRQAERAVYLKAKGKVTGKFSLAKKQWRDRKTHRYFKCASCGTILRVPKGKGKIEIRCPKCGATRVEKT